MSQRSQQHHSHHGHHDDRYDRHDERHAEHHGHGQHGHPQAPRQHAVADQAPVQNRNRPRAHRNVPADYTLGHAGRQLRIGPIAFWTCVGSLVIMAGWTIVTATYFAFRDDVLTRLIARQADMQYAYEDRIADMRAQVDRVTGRQLLDQDQFERRLDQIVKRQTALESRTMALASLTDSGITGSIRPRADLNPTPSNETAMVATPPAARNAVASARPRSTAKPTGVEGALARVQDSLDRVEARQTASLNAIEETYDGKVKRLRGTLTELGIDPGKAPATGAVGGPYVPYKLASNATPFERQIYRVNLTRAHADKLAKTMTTVPLRQPIPGELDQTSGFGVRVDPFVGRPAMHTGLDFRGSTGDPVRATATGTVTTAGWNGGYGRLVEVNHGNGLATRYGHLSEIDVHVGQFIRIGQIVGKLGSTGRSTGPHLHYETRVDGEAVDPTKFLRAGSKLGLN